MKEILISELFQFQKRFLRSANLERDFHDPKSLDGYVLTPQIVKHTKSIYEGLNPNSGKRAWKINGDFGSGKSSFALFLANVFSNKFNQIPDHLSDNIKIKIKKPDLLPLLITGSREPLSNAIIRTLATELKRFENENFSEIINKLTPRSNNEYVLSDKELISIISESNSKIILHTEHQGLLIIIDELGKFLEYSTLNPDQQDIYLLQELAEVSSRSKENPLLLVGLLHQGLSNYAEYLTPVAQREWEKISGRFDEINFDHPIEQIFKLIEAALNINQKKLPRIIQNNSKQTMQKTLQLEWYGLDKTNKSFIASAPGIYPLHPTVLPILTNVFSHFGQYQRSLFSFLMSNEPFGLMDFSRQSLKTADFYRLYNLFDYVRSTFGYYLSTQSYRSNWNLIESLIESYSMTKNTEDLEIKVLKTVGLLNLVNSQKYLATEDVIIASMEDENKGIDKNLIRQTIKKLNLDNNILHSRGIAGGYCLWAYTSVNLDIAYDKASRVLKQISSQRVSSLVETYLNPRPIVARRHYIQTGNLRHFEVYFSSVEKLKSNLKYDWATTDGRIVVALCETAEERRETLEIAKNFSSEEFPNLIIAVPRPLEALGKLFQEVQRWEWIKQNTPELSADKYANQEVIRHLSNAKQTLDKRIQSLIGLYQFTDDTNLEWFYLNKKILINNNRELLEILSTICDECFSLAPKVHNELINRREPSAVANKARTQLLSGIFEKSSKPFLGMNPDKKPPEMAIYLSILKRSGIHKEVDKNFELAIPKSENDVCNLLPAFDKIRKVLEQNADSRIVLTALIDQLALPPYGIRRGLSPILIAIFAVINEQHIAFYDRGVFMQEMKGLDILRFTKSPDSFEIQFCKVAGFRSEFFKKLLEVLETHPELGKHTAASKNGKENVLDVVRPLSLFVAELPKYTLKTGQLSKSTMAVRNALLNAKEPATLLFIDLPVACGFQELNPETPADKLEYLVTALKNCISELHRAYLKLHERIFDSLKGFFDLPESLNITKVREELQKRSDKLLTEVKEVRLKGFCLQLNDSNLSDADWLELLGSFVVSIPPNKWQDIDEEKFVQELGVLVGKFLRVESIYFNKHKGHKNQSVFRLSITRPDGTEVEKIIYTSKDEEVEIAEIKSELSRILEKKQTLGIKSLASMFWELTSQSE